MSRRKAAALCALAFTLAAAWLWPQREEPLRDESTAGRTVASAPANASPGDAIPAESPAAPKPRVPLPPVDAPLALILESLAERADAGDAKAACRLAMELIRCQATAYLLGNPAFDSEARETEMEAAGRPEVADAIAAQSLEQVRVARECLAVPPRLKDRGPGYLGQAARAGEPEAMVRYADSQFWPPDGRGSFSDPEFDLWRRDAPGMLQRAFAAGVPESAFVMMDAYQSDFSLVGSMIPNDPVKAEAIRMLMVRLHGWQERLVPSSLDAATLSRARHLAQQWHEGPFKGRSYRGQDRATFEFVGLSRRNGKPHEFCRDDRPPPP